MQTKIGAVVGTMLFLIGMIVLFANQQTQMSTILQDFLGDVNPFLWGSLNVFAGFLLMWPGGRVRNTRLLVAALIPVMWVGVCLWPLLLGDAERISPVGVVLWGGLATLIVLDRNNVMFDPELKKYSDYHKEK